MPQNLVQTSTMQFDALKLNLKFLPTSIIIISNKTTTILTGLLLDLLLVCSEVKISLTMPSSAMEVPVLEDKGGEGVAERNEEAPDESTGEGKFPYNMGLPKLSKIGKLLPY